MPDFRVELPDKTSWTITVPFTVERLGLNRDQIEQYDPPPFWAKSTSSRYDKYIEDHSWVRDRAWELDALEPTVLRDLAVDAIESFFDEHVHNQVQAAVGIARERFNKELYDTVLPRLLQQRGA